MIILRLVRMVRVLKVFPATRGIWQTLLNTLGRLEMLNQPHQLNHISITDLDACRASHTVFAPLHAQVAA